MKASDVLYQQETKPEPKKLIDYEFEKMVILCGVGCLIHDIAMDENDYVRLHLALSRVGSQL